MAASPAPTVRKVALKIVIVGGGAAGLFASLLLARAGHQIIVLDQDQLESSTALP